MSSTQSAMEAIEAINSGPRFRGTFDGEVKDFLVVCVSPSGLATCVESFPGESIYTIPFDELTKVEEDDE